MYITIVIIGVQTVNIYITIVIIGINCSFLLQCIYGMQIYTHIYSCKIFYVTIYAVWRVYLLTKKFMLQAEFDIPKCRKEMAVKLLMNSGEIYFKYIAT